jgi:hypothetical protein
MGVLAMLIDKGVTPGEVVSLKLTSGEELVAKLVEETTEYFKLSKPLVLSMSAQGIGMMPYLFTVNPDKDIKLMKVTVTVIESTDKQFADQYLSGTTGIKLS